MISRQKSPARSTRWRGAGRPFGHSELSCKCAQACEEGRATLASAGACEGKTCDCDSHGCA
eukprot:5653899-Pleurochrysis_carterae.AAC.1